MKKYLLVRWKKRWRVVLASAVVAPIWIARSLTTHDPNAPVLRIIILLLCFDVVVILFPFHWGGENWNGD